MPPKKRKFESTFPAARIKKIMQLDDDVGRVASSVPIVISRAVEMFLEALLSKANTYASSRNAKTLTVGHIKHCIENEKQWDFLQDLTANVPDINACNEAERSPKRGRKRKNSSSKAVDVASKRKPKKVEKLESKPESNTDSGQDEEDVSDSSSPGSSSHSSHTSHPKPHLHAPSEPSPLAILQKRLCDNNVQTPPPIDQPHPSVVQSSSSPLMALANSLSSKQALPLLPPTTIGTKAVLSKNGDNSEDNEYD